MKRTHRIVAVVVALHVAPSAFAYLDPGSGSMLLQVVLGGLAAVGVAGRLYWHRLKNVLGLGRRTQDRK